MFRFFYARLSFPKRLKTPPKRRQVAHKRGIRFSENPMPLLCGFFLKKFAVGRCFVSQTISFNTFRVHTTLTRFLIVELICQSISQRVRQTNPLLGSQIRAQK
ncbi:MAG: hypothetical protein D6714_18820 [Bacteroidetes bacterium]|nr:MAG: hypothetical protein D6714_18820 [Bacteroidota bacterium]